MSNVRRPLPALVAGPNHIGEMNLEDIALANPQDHWPGTLVGAQPDLAGASAVVGGGDRSQRLAVMGLVASDDVTAQREDKPITVARAIAIVAVCLLESGNMRDDGLAGGLVIGANILRRLGCLRSRDRGASAYG